MKRQIKQPPYSFEQSRTSKVVLPVTLAILGASVVIMAVMLITNENNKSNDDGSYDVENYDIVGNMPFIYSICE
jgi:hypothetical protein